MTESFLFLYAGRNQKMIAKATAFFKRKAPGYRLISADTLEKCVSELSRNSIDAVLIEDNLPEFDGIELLQQLIQTGLQCPAIVLAEAEDEDRDLQAMRIGAADYLAKHKNYLRTLPGILKVIINEHLQNQSFLQAFQDKTRHILLIEPGGKRDSETARHLRNRRAGIQVRVVGTCTRALLLLKPGHRFDIVITAFKLEDMNALEFLREAKYRGVNVPVILLTGKSSENAPVAALKLGAADYIIKRGNYLPQLSFCIDNAITRFQIELVNQHLRAEYEALSTSLDSEVRERTRELQESEERFRLISENAADLIAVLDQAGNIQYASPSFFYQLGRIPAEIVGASFSSILHHDDLHKFRTSLGLLISSKLPFVEDYRFHNQSGDTKIFEAAGNLIEAEHGDDSTIVIVSRDITLRKKIEAALSASESQYRKLTELSPVGIFHCDAKRYCLLVNEHWSRLSGLSLASAEGEGWLNAIHELDRIRVLDTWYDAIEKNIPFQLEYRFRQPSGDVVWIYGKAAAVMDGEGNITGFIETIIDITERKHAEKALQESEERYRRLMELSPETVLVHRDGRIVYMNKTGVNLFLGNSNEDFVGKSIYEFIHPDDHGLVTNRINQMRQTNRTLEPTHVKLFRMNGTRMDTEFASAPIIYRGKPAIQVVIKDVTESRQVEHKIQALVHGLKRVGDCLIVTDLEDKITFVNDAFQRAYGYMERELIGRDIGILRAPESAVEEAEIRSQTIAGGWAGELINVRKDGKSIHVHLTTSTVRDSNGIALAFVGIVRVIR